ncbi:MAG TPA: hypothetical protein DCR30_10790 [Afipia sp.]|nr:hypothetical protein [Afipia sp.]
MTNVIRKAASDEDFEDKLIRAITTAVRKRLKEDPGLEVDPEFAITFSEYFSEVPGPTGYTSFRVTILRKDRKQLLKSLRSGNSGDWTEGRHRYEARLSDGSLLYDVSADVGTKTVHVVFW